MSARTRVHIRAHISTRHKCTRKRAQSTHVHTSARTCTSAPDGNARMSSRHTQCLCTPIPNMNSNYSRCASAWDTGEQCQKQNVAPSVCTRPSIRPGAYPPARPPARQHVHQSISPFGAWRAVVRHGMAWRGTAWRGAAWRGVTQQLSAAWLDMLAWCGVAWQRGMTCYSMVWRGTVWHGMAWCGMVWRGVAWYGMVWHGVAWCGMVWHGVAYCGTVWRTVA